MKFQLVPHPAYSPGIAPSDYYLFSNLKKWLGGQKISGDDEVIAAVNACLAQLDSTFFQSGIEALEKRLEKYVDLQGGYVEKAFQLVVFFFLISDTYQTALVLSLLS